MPSFLNPWVAAAAAGIVVPSLLLLYFLKLRRREVPVSSTLLWKKAIQDLQVNAPFQRLRRNLLLFLQLLILLALVLALSRPVMNYSPGAGKLAVILIDRSASMSTTDMDGHSRLDEAKRLAKELVDTMDKDGSAMVVAFDDSADIVRSFTSDRAALRTAIDSIQPTDRRSKLGRAFQLAEAKAMAFMADQLRPSGPRPELWLYSDGRIADRTEIALRYAELKKYTRLGKDDSGNLAIVSLSAKRNYERPTEVQVFVRLANYGPDPATAVLQLSVDGQIPPGGVKRDMTLLPDRWTPQQRDQAGKDKKLFARDSAEFTLELLTGAVLRIDLKEQANDLLAADDTAQVIVPPPRALNVLLVSRKGNRPLEDLLRSANIKTPAVIAPEGYEEKMKDPQAVASDYDVIIFDAYQPTKVPPAGNFMYFEAVPPDSKLTAATDANGRIFIKDDQVLDWDRNHPMMRSIGTLRFFAIKMLKLQVPLEAQTLVDGHQGPLVVLLRDGRRTHLVFAFDLWATNWWWLPSFPVVMDNALQYLSLGSEMNVRQSFQPGDTPRIPRYLLQQAGAQIKSVKITGPPGFGTVEATVPATGDFALPALEKVGVYSLDPPVPQFDKLAVNLLDESESNILPIDEAPGGTADTLTATGGGKARLELWWWLVAAAAVPLCMIEWWVYTRRVHL